MTKLRKRFKQIQEKIEIGKLYQAEEAFSLLKDVSTVKFDESVDVSVNLGVDARKSDQAVRGAVLLPHGSGRDKRVAVFAQGDNAKAAKAAGADIVGFEDLAERIKAGEMDFDVLISTPDAMKTVGELGPVLGPKGLMPNPKEGTVTTDIEKAVRDAKSGQVRFKTDRGGIVHCLIGKLSFSVENLKQNLEALLAELKRLKPEASKGVYLKKISVSSVMGPGLQLKL